MFCQEFDLTNLAQMPAPVSGHKVTGRNVHYCRIYQPISLESWWKVVGLKPEDLEHLLYLGAIYLNGRRVHQSTDLNSDDVLRIHASPRRYPMPTQGLQEKIVFESADFLFVKKPHGLPVHPTLDNWHENLLTWVNNHLESGQRAFLTHRIDQGTDGLIVLAKNPQAQRSLMKCFANGSVNKEYCALIEMDGSGEMDGGGNSFAMNSLQPESLLEHWMMPSEYSPKILTSNENPDWKYCASQVLKIEPVTHKSFQQIHLKLITGRTHQIRAQLANLGHPVVGDKLYGSLRAWGVEEQGICSWALRSRKIGFKVLGQNYEVEIEQFHGPISTVC